MIWLLPGWRQSTTDMAIVTRAERRLPAGLSKGLNHRLQRRAGPRVKVGGLRSAYSIMIMRNAAAAPGSGVTRGSGRGYIPSELVRGGDGIVPADRPVRA